MGILTRLGRPGGGRVDLMKKVNREPVGRTGRQLTGDGHSKGGRGKKMKRRSSRSFPLSITPSLINREGRRGSTRYIGGSPA